MTKISGRRMSIIASFAPSTSGSSTGRMTAPPAAMASREAVNADTTPGDRHECSASSRTTPKRLPAREAGEGIEASPLDIAPTMAATHPGRASHCAGVVEGPAGRKGAAQVDGSVAHLHAHHPRRRPRGDAPTRRHRCRPRPRTSPRQPRRRNHRWWRRHCGRDPTGSARSRIRDGRRRRRTRECWSFPAPPRPPRAGRRRGRRLRPPAWSRYRRYRSGSAYPRRR